MRLSCLCFFFASSCVEYVMAEISMHSSPVKSRSPCVMCKRVRRHVVVVGGMRDLLEHSSDMSLSGRGDLPCAVVAQSSVLGTVFM